MKTAQATIQSPNDPLEDQLSALTALSPDFLLVFGAVEFFEHPVFFNQLKTLFPSTHMIGCSTAGEISRDGVSDGEVIITAVKCDSTQTECVATTIMDMGDSLSAGERLGAALAHDDLRAIIILGRGIEINGSALIEGLAHKVGRDILISGGLAGDGGKFQKTFTVSNEAVADDQIVALGLYGDNLQLSFGSFGGWKSFGPVRQITRSRDNILFELDGEPALNIYKRYLGEFAKDLPSSGLLFPFEIVEKDQQQEEGLIRTILGINEEDGSLILAGAIEEGGVLRLMQASTEALIEGAEKAAEQAADQFGSFTDGLALLISCVGRKLVMGDMVDEEVEAVADVLGKDVTITGFYSYGEINPSREILNCKLHNQTMTIAYISEA